MNAIQRTQEEKLQRMAKAIEGKQLEGWTILRATVQARFNAPWTMLWLEADATNGKGDFNRFRYDAGRPLNQLAKFAEGLL